MIEIDMGNMSGVIIRRNPESGVISERFPVCTRWVAFDCDMQNSAEETLLDERPPTFEQGSGTSGAAGLRGQLLLTKGLLLQDLGVDWVPDKAGVCE